MDLKNSSKKRGRGRGILLERKQCVSIKGQGDIYITNTQTQVHQLYRRDQSSDKTSSHTDEKLIGAGVQVKALNMKIESEIGKLKSFRNNLTHGDKKKTSRVQKKESSKVSWRQKLLSGIATSRACNSQPVQGGYSSPESDDVEPFFRTMCVVNSPLTSNNESLTADTNLPIEDHVDLSLEPQDPLQITRMCGGCLYNNDFLPCSSYQCDYAQSYSGCQCSGIQCPQCYSSCRDCCNLPLSALAPCSPNYCSPYPVTPDPCSSNAIGQYSGMSCTYCKPGFFRCHTDLNTEAFCRDRLEKKLQSSADRKKETRRGASLRKSKNSPRYKKPNQDPKAQKTSQAPTESPKKALQKEKMIIKDYVRGEKAQKETTSINVEKKRLHREYMEMYQRELERTAGNESVENILDLESSPTYTKLVVQEESHAQMSASFVRDTQPALSQLKAPIKKNQMAGISSACEPETKKFCVNSETDQNAKLEDPIPAKTMSIRRNKENSVSSLNVSIASSMCNSIEVANPSQLLTMSTQSSQAVTFSFESQLQTSHQSLGETSERQLPAQTNKQNPSEGLPCSDLARVLDDVSKLCASQEKPSVGMQTCLSTELHTDLFQCQQQQLLSDEQITPRIPMCCPELNHSNICPQSVSKRPLQQTMPELSSLNPIPTSRDLMEDHYTDCRCTDSTAENNPAFVPPYTSSTLQFQTFPSQLDSSVEVHNTSYKSIQQGSTSSRSEKATWTRMVELQTQLYEDTDNLCKSRQTQNSSHMQPNKAGNLCEPIDPQNELFHQDVGDAFNSSENHHREIQDTTWTHTPQLHSTIGNTNTENKSRQTQNISSIGTGSARNRAKPVPLQSELLGPDVGNACEPSRQDQYTEIQETSWKHTERPTLQLQSKMNNANQEVKSRRFQNNVYMRPGTSGNCAQPITVESELIHQDTGDAFKSKRIQYRETQDSSWSHREPMTMQHKSKTGNTNNNKNTSIQMQSTSVICPDSGPRSWNRAETDPFESRQTQFIQNKTGYLGYNANEMLPSDVECQIFAPKSQQRQCISSTPRVTTCIGEDPVTLAPQHSMRYSFDSEQPQYRETQNNSQLAGRVTPQPTNKYEYLAQFRSNSSPRSLNTPSKPTEQLAEQEFGLCGDSYHVSTHTVRRSSCSSGVRHNDREYESRIETNSRRQQTMSNGCPNSVKSTRYEKETRSVTFQDQSGGLSECSCCRTSIDWEQVHQLCKEKDEELDHLDIYYDDLNNTRATGCLDSFRSSSTAGTEFTCNESHFEEDYTSCNNLKTDSNQPGLPPFNGCPCMYKEYLKLVALCSSPTMGFSHI